jgi:hypothetical protein
LGASIPTDKLDRLVSERLAERVLMPDRVGKLLAGLLERQTAREGDHADRMASLRAKLTDAQARLGSLYAAIESGIPDPTDVTLKDRVAAAKTEQDMAQVAFDRAAAELRPGARITADKIAVVR